MIRIVLDVQPDKGLRKTVYNGQGIRCWDRDPKVLQRKEESDVKESTKKVTVRTIFTPSSYNLKYLTLNVTFERCIPFVSDNK